MPSSSAPANNGLTCAAYLGMAGFGAGAPYKDLYNAFGITPQAVAEAAR
jgi:transketolase